MSLFPAYSDGKQKLQPPAVAKPEGDKKAAEKKEWHNNASYSKSATTSAPIAADYTSTSDSESDESDFNSDNDSSDANVNSTGSLNSNFAAPKRILEFDNTVEFYVDKTSNRAFSQWKTLPRLARPQYKKNLRRLTDSKRYNGKRWKNVKRLRYSQFVVQTTVKVFDKSDAKAQMERLKMLKTKLAGDPQNIQHWMDVHDVLGLNTSKLNCRTVSEHQLRSLETALRLNPGNEKLLQLYVATLSSTYPDTQVAAKIEDLLQRHPFEYTLWTSLIMTVQGTMARCNVPDVLKIYERCMARMFLGQKDYHTDDLMLRLFHNCVLFLRQSSNTARMFTLLKVALEMHAPGINFNCFEAKAEDEVQLVEYEELVLRSGMPMPEIWTRVENLRQAFNFLPYPQMQNQNNNNNNHSRSQNARPNAALDPQRCVYVSDVCRYIHPLKQKENMIQLMLLATQLTKMPFVRTHCLSERLSARIEQMGDSDAIEMLLVGVLERSSYALPLSLTEEYTKAVLQLCKELYVNPSYLPYAIGCEIFEECLNKLIIKCGRAFVKARSETRRRVFVLLWFRFERLRLILLQHSGKMTDLYLTNARHRHRNALREDANRTVTRFYTEMALFEYEVDKPAAYRVLDNIINNSEPNLNNVELLHANVVYAEILIGNGQPKEALNLLNCLVLQQFPKLPIKKTQAQILELAREQLNLSKAAAIRMGTADLAMPLEDYFMPNQLLLLLRAHCLTYFLLGTPEVGQELIIQLMDVTPFAAQNLDEEDDENTPLESKQCRFLYEQLRELQIILYQLALPQRAVLGGGQRMIKVLEQSLIEFPRNLMFLQCWSTQATLPWYKLRGRLVHTKAGILSLLHLIIAARCRFKEQSEGNSDGKAAPQQLENIVRNRVLSMFQTFLPHNKGRSQEEIEQYGVLRRNSLYWRCYLRCLSHEGVSFERSKRVLLMALDECPWDKALYMDGVTYVPQEFVCLQDVMTEKQLRIYALPEELTVLRDG